MIAFELIRENSLVIIEPSGALEKSDFEKLTKEIDAYINEKGSINGIIIHSKKFPRWDSFGSFIHHMQFIKNHHKKIRKIAAVTDSKFMSIAPKIANHFVSAEIKQFCYDDMKAAEKWILE